MSKRYLEIDDKYLQAQQRWNSIPLFTANNPAPPWYKGPGSVPPPMELPKKSEHAKAA